MVAELTAFSTIACISSGDAPSMAADETAFSTID
jgi:hypothetical protein